MPDSLQINAYSTLVDEHLPDCAAGNVIARCVRRADGSLDPDVREHLNGMAEFVSGDAGPHPALDALLDHVRHVWWHYCFSVDTDALPQALEWARTANAILFVPGQGLLDPAGRDLLPADGTAAGRVPVTRESAARARAQRDLLAHRGIATPPQVPPLRGESETVPRDAEDVALRALALTLTAYFAGAVLTKSPAQLNATDMRRDYPRAFDALSAQETELFRRRERELAGQLQWEHLAAESLLWALERIPARLPDAFPAGHDVLTAALVVPERTFLDEARLRPLGELLDEAERESSLRGAFAAGVPVDTSGMQPRVVEGRDRALRWLLDPRLTSWDDVR